MGLNLTTEELAAHLEGEVNARCDTKQELEGPEDAFTEVFLEYLAEADLVEGWELGFAQKPGRRGAPAFKVNAWHLHSQAEGGSDSAPMVDIFISIFDQDGGGKSVPVSKVTEGFTLARNFLAGAMTAFGGKVEGMEESAPPYESVQTIYRHRAELEGARIFLLTNGIAKQAKVEDTVVEGLRVRHELWDLEKLQRLLSDGVGLEKIEIDLAGGYGGAVPCVGREDGTGEYTSYLAFFPATLLASIYADYGPRLLEKNVRSYLQARGKVNKGIQSTIREVPHRFLAYNNGISATAEAVTLDADGRMAMLRDFQIVNGGQTTASIYHALRKEKADISKVAVQLKVTVVHDEAKVAEFVPLISLYANSQNKVNTADFSSNDIFHQRLEGLSRTTWAPVADGMAKPTRWYYERARGSHLDEKARAGTPARQKAWLAVHPIAQKFTKTDVAKYLQAWDQLPFLVCKGAEKNFLEWTLRRLKAKFDDPDGAFFKELVGKAILWRRAEKIFAGMRLGGYRAPSVAYSVAWLSRETGGRLDFFSIWEKQGLSRESEDALRVILKEAFDYLVETAGGRNVTEWAKKEECWEGFRGRKIVIPDLGNCLEGRVHSVKGPQESVGATKGEALGKFERIRAEVWQRLGVWGRETGSLADWQRTMCGNVHRKLITGKKLKPPEVKMMLEMLDVARGKGFSL